MTPKASPSSFYKLCNSIRAKAILDLQQKGTDSQLVKWQKLLTAILETELAIHRVRSALKQLKAIPPNETLSMFSMSEGAWIDYHYTTWSFLMYGLLEREKSLVRQVIRNLVKPHNSLYKDIEKTMLKSIKAQKDKIGKVRNPLAHTGEGGVIEAISTDFWKVFLVLPSPVDFNHILKSCEPYHVRWHYFLHQVSVAVLAEMERVSEELSKNIKWESV